MSRRQSVPIKLTLQHRRILGKWHKGTLSMGFSRRVIIRVDIVMRAARGQTNYMIAKQLGISRNTVKLWRYRFAREGMAGLITRPIPGRPPKRRAQASPMAQGAPAPLVQELQSIVPAHG